LTAGRSHTDPRGSNFAVSHHFSETEKPRHRGNSATKKTENISLFIDKPHRLVNNPVY
jgi:hypothetical protein